MYSPVNIKCVPLLLIKDYTAIIILTLLYTFSGLIELILQTLYGWDSLKHRACSIPNTNLLAYPTAFEIESN